MKQDRAGFEHADRFGAAAIDERRNLAVGIYLDEATAELVALADADRPGIIFRLPVTLLQKLLEHDRDLLPVGRRERVKLERMLADGQLFVVGRSGDRPVDAG